VKKRPASFFVMIGQTVRTPCSGFYTNNYGNNFRLQNEVKGLLMKITSLLMCFLKSSKTTLELTYELMNVIPNNAIDEHLVYEALRELGF
jgi:hypothetical protein